MRSSVRPLEVAELGVSCVGNAPGEGGGAGICDTTTGPFHQAGGYEFPSTLRRGTSEESGVVRQLAVGSGAKNGEGFEDGPTAYRTPYRVSAGGLV